MGAVARYLLVATFALGGGYFIGQQPLPESGEVGKVEMVYVEISRGFLVDRKMVKRSPGPLLAEVAMPPRSPTPTAYAWLDRLEGIEEGDLVAFSDERTNRRKAHRLERDDDRFYETTIVAHLKAKHDTLEATAFTRHPLAPRRERKTKDDE